MEKALTNYSRYAIITQIIPSALAGVYIDRYKVMLPKGEHYGKKEPGTLCIR